MTKNDLKETICNAFLKLYGFAPTKSSIILQEAHGDGSYILFRVGVHVYRYSKLQGVGCEKIEEVAV